MNMSIPFILANIYIHSYMYLHIRGLGFFVCFAFFAKLFENNLQTPKYFGMLLLRRKILFHSHNTIITPNQLTYT